MVRSIGKKIPQAFIVLLQPSSPNAIGKSVLPLELGPENLSSALLQLTRRVSSILDYKICTCVHFDEMYSRKVHQNSVSSSVVVSNFVITRSNLQCSSVAPFLTKRTNKITK